MEMQLHNPAPDMSGFTLPQNWQEAVDIAAITPVDFIDAPAATTEHSAADLSIFTAETADRKQVLHGIGEAALDPYARFETAAMRDAKAQTEADQAAFDATTERRVNEMHFLTYMADITRHMLFETEESKPTKKTTAAGSLALAGASK